MNQDKSSPDKALTESADQGSVGSAPESYQDIGKQKQSVVGQPVDALRQSIDHNHGQSSANRTTGQASKSGNSKSKTHSGSTSTMDSNQQATHSKSSGSRGVWGGLFLGLVLVAVALGVGLWWQQQRFEAVAREIATRLQQSDQMITLARDNASQALALASAQREVVDDLSRDLAVAVNELKTLQQAWEAANEGLDQTLLLNDLERLINMANQELALFGNVNSAVSILSSVDAMLKGQAAPALKVLQQAVITDLARLRSVPQVDVTSLSARLDSLIQLTGKAPLMTPSGIATDMSRSNAQTSVQRGASGQTDQAAQGNPSGGSSAAAAAAASDQSPWWSSWDLATGKVSQWASEAGGTLLREFADVMSIRKADDPQALLLSEEQAIQLRANVRAMLLSAQLALMTRQADIWRSELNEVQSLLNTRYDTQALDTKASLSLLNELLDAPVAAEVPQLTETLSALALAERALTIPVDSAGDRDTQTDSTQREPGTGAAEPTAENPAASEPVGASPDNQTTKQGN